MISYKNVHQQVINFKKILLTYFQNFMPNRFVAFDDKYPPWMTEKLKLKIKGKHIYRDYLKNGKTKADYMYVNDAITKFSQLILESKDKYYNKLAMKLNNIRTTSNTYWSTLKNFYNGRKLPIIPPLLKDGKLESDFKIEVNYFGFFFLVRVLL